MPSSGASSSSGGSSSPEEWPSLPPWGEVLRAAAACAGAALPYDDGPRTPALMRGRLGPWAESASQKSPGFGTNFLWILDQILVTGIQSISNQILVMRIWSISNQILQILVTRIQTISDQILVTRIWSISDQILITRIQTIIKFW